ncbi:MAG: prephenate dehydratase [Actinomycetota bacterium]|nr:prephenate dehydratase [Actinomycetota bacterium]
MRLGYLGPDGTFTHEALTASRPGLDDDLVALPTIYDTVMAVHERTVDRALVPIENSLEGSVNATLDALAVETEDVCIVGELVHPIRHCLIARRPMALEDIQAVVSIPQATAQCSRFIRTRLPRAAVLPANSTADAVRLVSESDDPVAALGNRLAADIYGCEVLHAEVEDLGGNETRFVWLAPRGAPSGEHGPWKTSIVFWGVGDDVPGWLVRCLSEFAFRGVNLTLIESRPRKRGLGRYMFFADLEGRESDPPVRGAVDAVRAQTEQLRVLGSYPSG